MAEGEGSSQELVVRMEDGSWQRFCLSQSDAADAPSTSSQTVSQPIDSGDPAAETRNKRKRASPTGRKVSKID